MKHSPKIPCSEKLGKVKCDPLSFFIKAAEGFIILSLKQGQAGVVRAVFSGGRSSRSQQGPAGLAASVNQPAAHRELLSEAQQLHTGDVTWGVDLPHIFHTI